ncbi:hypothetical protein D3C76_813530 [compost metagenome]
MRKMLCTTLVFLACLPAAEAASCRAGTAAKAGSEAGYNRAKEAADAWSQRQDNVTSSLADCLGNISTTITAPTFPNLADVMNQIGQKICQAARDKISDYVPPTIDPWGDYASSSGISSYTSGTKSIPVSTQTSTTATDSGRSFISLN